MSKKPPPPNPLSGQSDKIYISPTGNCGKLYVNAIFMTRYHIKKFYSWKTLSSLQLACRHGEGSGVFKIRQPVSGTIPALGSWLRFRDFH